MEDKYMELKATILRSGSDENVRYFDKNGEELFEGDYILDGSKTVKKLYRAENRELGTDATNPIHIERGLAVPCEAGIYPLEFEEMTTIEKFKESK